jgi:hypothetical protein
MYWVVGNAVGFTQFGVAQGSNASNDREMIIPSPDPFLQAALELSSIGAARESHLRSLTLGRLNLRSA